MAFKMKGSAFKLGNVATKSVLKHSGDVERKDISSLPISHRKAIEKIMNQ